MAKEWIHDLSDTELERRVATLLGETEAGPYHYTSDLAAMWRVVEWLRGAGWLVTLHAMAVGEHCLLLVDEDDPAARFIAPYTCLLSWVRCDDPQRYIWSSSPFVTGDTPGQAVCRAALEAEQT